MARRRKNPPKCSIDVADYGIDIGDYADNLMEIMNDEAVRQEKLEASDHGKAQYLK